MTWTLLVLGVLFLNAVIADILTQIARHFPRYKVLELTGFVFLIFSPLFFLIILAILIGAKTDEAKKWERQ